MRRAAFAWTLCGASVLFFLGSIDASALELSELRTSLVLDEDTYPVWRDAIETQPDEARWQEIPWRTSLRDGLKEASAARKPATMPPRKR